jgi:hypothetical protein
MYRTHLSIDPAEWILFRLDPKKMWRSARPDIGGKD